MKLSTMLRYGLARMLLRAGGLQFVPQWVNTTFFRPTFRALSEEGYKKNAVVFACLSAFAFAFPEPPLIPYDDEGDKGQPLLDHPLRRLIRRPNPAMGERELKAILMIYMGIGGNAYLHKVRDLRGQVVELYPYHAGNITPIPDANWISHYEYDNGDGTKKRIETTEIIHLKWPSIDPAQPWIAIPPLLPVARDVDADNEATRYAFALLKNDAVPRLVITAPPDTAFSDPEVKRQKEQFNERHGGENRGGVLFLERGATASRIALNLEELAFDALHRIPETRICAAYRTPPVIAGLGDDPTYANSEQAYIRWTRSTLVPLWTMFESELQEQLAPDFDDNVVLRHDLTNVQALQEDTNKKWERLNSAVGRGWMMVNEARRAAGYEEKPNGDVFLWPMSVIPQQPEGVTVVDANATDQARALPAPKLLTGPIEQRAGGKEVDRIERKAARAVETYLRRQYEQAAQAAEGGA